MNIVVNGRRLLFTGSQIDYMSVVRLAGESGHPSVMYRAAAGITAGSMHLGCRPVELEEGMMFSVMHTRSA